MFLETVLSAKEKKSVVRVQNEDRKQDVSRATYIPISSLFSVFLIEPFKQVIYLKAVNLF